MSEPKPAQEWSDSYVADLHGRARTIASDQNVAAAHNAALAAKQRYIDEIRTTTYSDLEAQLAAEREKLLDCIRKREQEDAEFSNISALTVQLREQLAAEQERTETYRRASESYQRSCEHLGKQLAAERVALAAAQAALGRATDATGISWDTSTEALDAYVTEKMKPLVDALKRIHDGEEGDVSNSVANYIVATVAKVEETPFYNATLSNEVALIEAHRERESKLHRREDQSKECFHREAQSKQTQNPPAPAPKP